MQRKQPVSGFVTQHRFVILFFTLIAFLLLVPVVHQLRLAYSPTLPPILENFIFVAVLVAAVISVSNKHSWRFLGVALGLPAAVLGVLRGVTDGAVIAVAHHVIVGAFLGYVVVVMFVFIFTTRRVTTNTVCASLCIYLILGAVWALGYSLLHRFDPGAFRSTVSDPSVELRFGEGGSTGVLYFSFCTLTTLGYGDIVPISPLARTLASVEAITGQLYLAVLVARLVGLHIAESSGSGKEATPPVTK